MRRLYSGKRLITSTNKAAIGYKCCCGSDTLDCCGDDCDNPPPRWLRATFTGVTNCGSDNWNDLEPDCMCSAINGSHILRADYQGWPPVGSMGYCRWYVKYPWCTVPINHFCRQLAIEVTLQRTSSGLAAEINAGYIVILNRHPVTSGCYAWLPGYPNYFWDHCFAATHTFSDTTGCGKCEALPITVQNGRSCGSVTSVDYASGGQCLVEII